MKLPAEQKVMQVERLLSCTDRYLRAADIARACNCSRHAVYAAVRKLRERNIGIHSTSNGYVISAAATKNDDVQVFRKINGRRTGEMIMLAAAWKHIRYRWKSKKNQELLKLMVAPCASSLEELNISRDTINILTNK